MAHPKYRDCILETIDQLRKRKARPDLERICHMVERKHGLSTAETEAQLEKLVDSEIVIKVDYKGNTSYRNGAKWKKSHLGGVVLNSATASKRLHEAISALNTEESIQDKEGTGASIRDIKSWLQANYDDDFSLKSPFNIVLQREIDAGRIEKLPNGHFSLPDSTQKDLKPKLESKQIPGTPSRRGRPPKNKPFGLKKPPKVRKSYGSDEVEEPMDTAPAPPVPEARCDFCQQTSATNRKGRPEKLLICKDCNAKAHPSCMDYSVELARRARRIPWQCIDCKTCYICDDAGDPDLMLFCDGCDKGYHTNCHQPPVTEKPSGKWVCAECETDGVSAEALDQEAAKMAATKGLSINTEPGPSFLHTPCDSPVGDINENNSNCFRAESKPDTKPARSLSLPLPTEPQLVDEVYPDASEWTIDDVVTFFKSVGYEPQSEAFREQEIDGKSLLLMKRSDVLTGLSIKLGPALKIHRHVEGLQTAGLESPH